MRVITTAILCEITAGEMRRREAQKQLRAVMQQMSSPQPVNAQYATACSLSSVTGSYGFVLTG